MSKCEHCQSYIPFLTLAYEKPSSRKEYTHIDNDDGYPEPDKRKSNIRLQGKSLI